jgi:DNA-binding GntR family transcriptional regulator
MKIKNGDSIESIYAYIKHFLLNSDIYPGQKIPHAELGKKMGTSFSPLREAFTRLSSERLLIHKNQRGFFVPKISYEEARDLYDTRILIEPYLVRKAVTLINDKKIDILNDILNQYHKMAFEPYSRKRLLIDKRFHLEILELGNNKELFNIVDSIFNLLIVRRTIVHLSPDRPHKAYSEHSEILESLKDRDGKKASQLMKEHIKIIKKMVLDDILKNKQNSSDYNVFQ